MRRPFTLAIGGLVVLFLLIQLIPFGHDHTIPPVQAKPPRDRPLTRSLAEAACFDCHSNQTIWPWYSNVRRCHGWSTTM